MPGTAALHEIVAVAVGGTVTDAGAMASQVNPAGTASVRVTVPVKELTAVIVIVEVVDVMTVTAAGEVAEIVKSLVVVKVAVAE